MMMPPPEFNSRVLVIDDEDSVRDSFGFALGQTAPRSQKLEDLASDLFDDDIPSRPTSTYASIEFELDVASTGREGFAKVEKALAEGRPYAVLFVDMRMPGWNGLETVEHVRRVDPRCEIIFVTAYSDQPVDMIVQKVGANVGYFLKPFATDEVKQMATKAVIDWNKAREMERLLQTLSSVDAEVDDIEELLGYLLGQLCLWLGTESGALVQLEAKGKARLRVGRGSFLASVDLNDIAASLNGEPVDKPIVRDEYLVLPIREFGFAVAVPGTAILTPERIYLLRVFLEHASLSIRNSETRIELARARRLATIGEALGCIVHDIRGPIGNVQLIVDYLKRGDTSLYEPDEAFDFIERSLVQVEATVNDTLDYVRGRMTVEPQDVELAPALAKSLTLIAFELERRGVRVRNALPKGLRAHVDVYPLVRALRNLAVNACDALYGAENPWVEIGARVAEETGVVVWVADNGPGIPDAVSATLFEPFVTAGKAKGTGLGLAVVRLITQAHGGTITVRSGDGGTRFELHLP